MALQDLIQETQHIYKDLPVGLCYLDTDLRFIHINGWLADINGIPAEEHLGRTIGELIPDVAAGVEAQFRQVIDTGEPIIGRTIEAATSAQPGIKRHFQHSYYPVRSDDGEVIGISCVVEDVTVRNEALAASRRANDELEQHVRERTAELRKVNESLTRQITERKRAEEELAGLNENLENLVEERTVELRASEARFRDFTDAASEWFWETDEKCRFKTIGGRPPLGPGMEPDKSLGRTREELAAPGVDPENWRRHRADMESRRPFSDFIYRRVDEAGDGHVLRVSGKPIFDAAGVFLGYRGVGSDITAFVDAEERARSAHERLAVAIDGLSETFMLFDADDRLIVNNRTWREFNRAITEQCQPGARFEDILRAQIQFGLIPEARGQEEKWLRARIARHRNPEGPFELARRDGQWLLIEDKPLPDGGVITVATNITQLKRTEEALKESEARAEQAHARLVDAIESVSEGFALWDLDDRLVLFNAKYLEVFSELSGILVAGVHFEDFLKVAVERGVYDTEGEPVESFVARRMAEHRNPTEAFERQVGDDRWVRISKRRTETGNVVGIWTDITERKKTEVKIRELAMTDPLTGLANRNRFNSDIERALANAKRQNQRVALLFLDIDKFKSVNDEFGHPVGDALLKQVANRLVATARETDTVARLGGDEFAIVVTHMERADTPAQLASRIIESLSTPFDLSGQSVDIGTSIGISVYPDDDTDVHELIRKADVALYQAKAEGGGYYRLYDAVMHEATRAVKRIERELRAAIDRDEFTLHYQPLFDISTKRITGAEALVRWQHPERGLLSPGEFISVAESSDLIVQIGRRVLQMACEQARQWRAEARMPALRVAVNISPRQFKSGELVGLVDDTLRQTGVAAESLELEITEGTMMEDVERANETLSRLNELGVSIAIDDFGTGYSSLAYLKRFPVQRLKIDQSFVGGLTTDRDDAAIVKAVIQLGHSLRLTVIAEGVETDAQLAALRDLGCDEAQGYLFCRPVPPEEFTAWVQARHKPRALEPIPVPA